MMNETHRTRRHWSWRSCFAAVKHNKKTKKNSNQSSNLTKFSENIPKKNEDLLDENCNHLCSSSNPTIDSHSRLLTSEFVMNEENNNQEDQTGIPSSCIIKIDVPLLDNEQNLIDGDSIEQINPNASQFIRSTQLDAIVEDSNEENSDDFDEILRQSTVRFFCDRDIITDATDLHSRLFDLSQMNHVINQFNELGHLITDFHRQIEKLKTKIDDIRRVSCQMPRDAELLEARYSTLLSTIESLSLLLKIGQIPACRSLINRLVFSIEQRSDQLNKLIQLSSVCSMTNPSSQHPQRRDGTIDEDFLSFRSALSSYEHLLTLTS